MITVDVSDETKENVKMFALQVEKMALNEINLVHEFLNKVSAVYNVSAVNIDFGRHKKYLDERDILSVFSAPEVSDQLIFLVMNNINVSQIRSLDSLLEVAKEKFFEDFVGWLTELNMLKGKFKEFYGLSKNGLVLNSIKIEKDSVVVSFKDGGGRIVGAGLNVGDKNLALKALQKEYDKATDNFNKRKFFEKLVLDFTYQSQIKGGKKVEISLSDYDCSFLKSAENCQFAFIGLRKDLTDGNGAREFNIWVQQNKLKVQINEVKGSGTGKYVAYFSPSK